MLAQLRLDKILPVLEQLLILPGWGKQTGASLRVLLPGVLRRCLDQSGQKRMNPAEAGIAVFGEFKDHRVPEDTPYSGAFSIVASNKKE